MITTPRQRDGARLPGNRGIVVRVDADTYFG
jgi:hypothetical protein